MHLRDLLSEKGRDVFTCSPDDSLAMVVDLLVGHNIGSLVVIDEGEMTGIITERDILRAQSRIRAALDDHFVRDFMTRSPVLASPADDVSEAMGLMTERRIRHLPIVHHGQLVGMISIGDLVKWQHAELCKENFYLKSYLNG